MFIFAITILPVIIWNLQNDFASFRFQSAGRVESMSGYHINIKGFLGVIGHQSAILMPVLFFSLTWLIYKTFKKYRLRVLQIPSEKLFLLCFFVPLFMGFICLSFVYWVKLNWMMPAYISGIIWVSTYFTGKWLRRQLLFSGVIHILLAVEVIFYPFPVKSDDTWVGWPQLASKVQQLRSTAQNTFIFSADDYKTTAALSCYSHEMI